MISQLEYLLKNLSFECFLSFPSSIYVSGHTNRKPQFDPFATWITNLAFSAKGRTQTEGSWK